MNENDDSQHNGDKRDDLLSMYDPNDDMVQDVDEENKHSNHLHLTLYVLQDIEAQSGSIKHQKQISFKTNVAAQKLCRDYS